MTIFPQVSFAHVRESELRNSGKLLLTESGIPGFGLQNPYQGIRNPTMESRAPFLERPGNFSGPESCRRVCIQIKV